jgi:hypothetical protein
MFSRSGTSIGPGHQRVRVSTLSVTDAGAYPAKLHAIQPRWRPRSPSRLIRAFGHAELPSAGADRAGRLSGSRTGERRGEGGLGQFAVCQRRLALALLTGAPERSIDQPGRSTGCRAQRDRVAPWLEDRPRARRGSHGPAIDAVRYRLGPSPRVGGSRLLGRTVDDPGRVCRLLPRFAPGRGRG